MGEEKRKEEGTLSLSDATPGMLLRGTSLQRLPHPLVRWGVGKVGSLRVAPGSWLGQVGALEEVHMRSKSLRFGDTDPVPCSACAPTLWALEGDKDTSLGTVPSASQALSH